MSRFLESLWNEIKDPYTSNKAGAGSADDYEVDKEKIRRMKLTFKGRDQYGNRIWEDAQGHQYTAMQLQKQYTDEPEGDYDTPPDKGGSQPVPNNDWQKYVPGAAQTNNFGNQYFGAGNPVLNPVTANPSQATASIPQVTQPRMEPQHRSAFTDPVSEDKELKSYLYIVSKNGRTVDDAARAFFELLNERAGEIFLHKKGSGEVFLIKGMSPDDVAASDATSHILARTVMSAIMGGTGYNHALRKHDVYLRVLPVDDPECNDMLFDNWNNGKVDLKDLGMLLRSIEGTELDTEDNYAKEILQAAIMGRMICERCATPEYERVKGTRTLYAAASKRGLKRECEIVNEMTASGFDNTKATTNAYELAPPAQLWYYPNKTPMKPPYLMAAIYLERDSSGRVMPNAVLGSKFIKTH